jgi:hypothetical protein
VDSVSETLRGYPLDQIDTCVVLSSYVNQCRRTGMVRTRTSGSCMRRLSLSICGNTVELAPNLMTILVHHPVNDRSICQSAPNLCVSAYVLYGRLCHRCFPGIGTTVNIVSASIIMPSSINPAVHMVTHTTPCTCFFLVSNLCLLPHYLVPFQKKKLCLEQMKPKCSWRLSHLDSHDAE